MIPERLPQRNADTIVAAFDDAYVVFDPRCNEVHLIEALSAVVYDACDGSSAAELISDIHEILGIDQTQAEGVVQNHLDEFALKGLLAGTKAAERPP